MIEPLRRMMRELAAGPNDQVGTIKALSRADSTGSLSKTRTATNGRMTELKTTPARRSMSIAPAPQLADALPSWSGAVTASRFWAETGARKWETYKHLRGEQRRASAEFFITKQGDRC